MQRKAKEFGLDLNKLPERTGNAPFGNTPPARPAGIAADATNPMAGADWNPRFVGGRVTPGWEFVQNQRRRLLLVQAWGTS